MLLVGVNQPPGSGLKFCFFLDILLKGRRLRNFGGSYGRPTSSAAAVALRWLRRITAGTRPSERAWRGSACCCRTSATDLPSSGAHVTPVPSGFAVGWAVGLFRARVFGLLITEPAALEVPSRFLRSIASPAYRCSGLAAERVSPSTAVSPSCCSASSTRSTSVSDDDCD